MGNSPADSTPPTGGPQDRPGPGGGQGPAAGKPGSHVFQAPTGTRDFYPAELSRLRYIQEHWRRTSINHGFDEIDGPAFEHLDLYTVKSGEGIVSELFSFERFGGEKTFALRPEFTPTLARMYASKAASLPKPTKWFWQQNCYRAERPQRGRLREFCQWNCDIIGDDSAAADAEVIACCVGMLESLGLTQKDVRVKINSRKLVNQVLMAQGVPVALVDKAVALLDKRSKMSSDQFHKECEQLGFDEMGYDGTLMTIVPLFLQSGRDKAPFTVSESNKEGGIERTVHLDASELTRLRDELAVVGVRDWCEFDASIARGLAYYTGMVFEVHEASGAERAIAGGGRYDKLIEMFGGPPTPAVGFGMGDVVLSLVLADKGLMPTDEDVAAELGLNPDALVISNGTPEADGAVAGVIASLRRAGLHVRRSYKTTKNIGKLIQDAAKMRARYCVILEGADKAQVKDMGTQGQEECSVAEIAGKVGK